MQTQCPHCETRFRVTQTQVDVADGIVRCGVCNEIFNAFEVANQHEHQASLLSEETSATPENPDDTPSIERSASAVVETDSPAITSTAFNAEKNKDPAASDLDFFNDDDAFSRSVVPDNFREPYRGNTHSVISTLLWSIAILVLTSTLLLEYIWFNRDRFSQVPEIQAGLEILCSKIECKNISIRDPSKIELITRNVYSHPKEKNALVINVTMRNNADFAQPYPILQIEFSNVRGGTVAARRFLPVDYMPIAAKGLPLLQPNASASLSMEIQDPGKIATTYEFNFL